MIWSVCPLYPGRQSAAVSWLGCTLLAWRWARAQREDRLQAFGRGCRAGCETPSPICWQQFNPSCAIELTSQSSITFIFFCIIRNSRVSHSSTAGFDLVADTVIWWTCPFEYNPLHCPGFRCFEEVKFNTLQGRGEMSRGVTQLLMPSLGWPLCTCSAECFSSGKVSWMSWVPGSSEHVSLFCLQS